MEGEEEGMESRRQEGWRKMEDGFGKVRKTGWLETDGRWIWNSKGDKKAGGRWRMDLEKLGRQDGWRQMEDGFGKVRKTGWLEEDGGWIWKSKEDRLAG